MTAALTTIGRSTVVTIAGIADVPAKVDTGADSSSVWASRISEQADGLHFVLFEPDSPYYSGEEQVIPTEHYRQMRIVSSSGQRQVRYQVDLSLQVEGLDTTVGFSLADRRTLSYPVLLGCSFLAGRLLVDCTKEIPSDVHQELTRQKHERRRAAQSEERSGR